MALYKSVYYYYYYYISTAHKYHFVRKLSTGHTYTIDRLLYVDHYSGRVGKYADNSGELTIYLHVSKWHAA